MASSTLLYIAWPVTLGLAFMAGNMIFSNTSTAEKSKNGNQPTKASHRNPSSNGSTNENSAAIDRRSSSTRSRIDKEDYAESYDIKEIANTSDPQKRWTMLLRMVDQLGPGDFEQVVTDFRELGVTKKRMAEYEVLFNAWAKINPEGALAYAEENTNTTFAVTAVLKAWAGYAPDAAIQWVKLNHKGNRASPYLVDIIKGIASTNPERATEMLPDILSRDLDHAINAITSQVSKLGTEKALAWLATIKDEKLHSGAAGSLATSLATIDPQGTIDWLQTLPADTQKNGYRISIARAWAELDIDKAIEWVNSLEPKHRASTAFQIMREIASSDPNKAAAWIKTMPSDSGYNKHFLRQLDSATKKPKRSRFELWDAYDEHLINH